MLKPLKTIEILSTLLMVNVVMTGSVDIENTLADLHSVSSENGILETSLTMENAIFTIPNSDIQLRSRLLNGTFPGPLLRLKPGDILRLHYKNILDDQGIPFKMNKISAPDETNIHFHGLHISGELPSDDPLLVVKPGESYSYSTALPSEHMPGTHWMHPHRHGATLLQVAGGAAGAVIVEDPPGTLPYQVQNAKEIVFLVQQLELEQLQVIASDVGDKWMTIEKKDSIGDDLNNYARVDVSNARNKLMAVNGQMYPVVPLIPGEWVRLRVIWVAWLRDEEFVGHLNLAIPGCEMQLLAKDGIYIRDFPRKIETAPIVPAGRADIMVRCMDVSKTYNIIGMNTTIATIQTSADPPVESTDLESWTPNYPPYLSDLRNVSASPGCSCITKVGKGGINGKKFNEHKFLHESYLGSVVERSILSTKHPYHQHVYPYQLVSEGFDKDGNGFNAIGDWHDTIEGGGVVRYRPTTFTGKVVLHCHRLKHEDKGMMAMEKVNNVTDDPTCKCGKVIIPTKSTPIGFILVSAACGILAFAGLTFFTVRFIRKKKRRRDRIYQNVETQNEQNLVEMEFS